MSSESHGNRRRKEQARTEFLDLGRAGFTSMKIPAIPPIRVRLTESADFLTRRFERST
jgi:hypothetical protein